MAKHHHRRYHYRRNPFGLGGGVFKDAGWTAAGALGSLYVTNFLPSYNTGWAGVGLTGVAAFGISWLGKMVGGPHVAEEVLKGGLVATIIRGLHQAGIASSIGLGVYNPAWFAVPTSSNPYLRTYAGNLPTAPPPPPRTMSGLGYRSRFLPRYRA